jgi:hypothetical protein
MTQPEKEVACSVGGDSDLADSIQLTDDDINAVVHSDPQPIPSDGQIPDNSDFNGPDPGAADDQTANVPYSPSQPDPPPPSGPELWPASSDQPPSPPADNDHPHDDAPENEGPILYPPEETTEPPGVD